MFEFTVLSIVMPASRVSLCALVQVSVFNRERFAFLQEKASVCGPCFVILSLTILVKFELFLAIMQMLLCRCGELFVNSADTSVVCVP